MILNDRKTKAKELGNERLLFKKRFLKGIDVLFLPLEINVDGDCF